jgi:putative aldouronate transport system permease protein
VTYAPHFVSIVVVVGMLRVFMALDSGVVNHIVEAIFGRRILFFGKDEWFRPMYIISGIWQHTGWNSIIYLAVLSTISEELYEAAIVDGATKLQRIWYIDIPGIIPTAIILLILSVGRIMNVGFENAFLMQTPLNMAASEIIPTYVYKVGIIGAQYSFSAAVGLFNSIINTALLVGINRVAKSMSQTSLW